MKPVKYNANAIETTIDNIFDNFFSNNISNFVGSDFFVTSPSTNVIESDNEYRIEVAAPGLDKADFNLNLDQDLLIIEANKEAKTEENTEKFVKREFNYTSFKRSFTLPDTVNTESIHATYKNGVLNVSLPKKEEAKPIPARTIKVK